ncbi:MAG: hypothetical protein CW338_04570 [Clostridiales bacterium]|nr:hypothetical protein [Clostridiales bacterium]
MICEECGKNNADVIIKTVINGQVHQRQLCHECAQKLQLPGIQNVLAGALGAAAGGLASAGGPKCPGCGLPFASFLKNGFLGCEKCYDSFRPLIAKRLNEENGAPVYSGKAPDPSMENKRKKINEFIEKMNENCEDEDYSSARSCFESVQNLLEINMMEDPCSDTE